VTSATAHPDRSDQGWLARLFAERAAWCSSSDQHDVTVQVLLRCLDLADLVYGARDFATRLAPGETDGWRRSWTKARFLFGNPANLTERTPARFIAPGGNVAWLGPFASERLPGMCRLLKPVTGMVPALPGEISFPPPGCSRPRWPPRELQIALRGLTLAEYLVHLHHTLAESVLQTRLRGDESLRLVHRLDIDTEAVTGSDGYARVHYVRGDTRALRLYTWLRPSGNTTC
jgi:hypothetical protein